MEERTPPPRSGTLPLNGSRIAAGAPKPRGQKHVSMWRSGIQSIPQYFPNGPAALLERRQACEVRRSSAAAVSFEPPTHCLTTHILRSIAAAGAVWAQRGVVCPLHHLWPGKLRALGQVACGFCVAGPLTKLPACPWRRCSGSALLRPTLTGARCPPARPPARPPPQKIGLHCGQAAVQHGVGEQNSATHVPAAAACRRCWLPGTWRARAPLGRALMATATAASSGPTPTAYPYAPKDVSALAQGSTAVGTHGPCMASARIEV